MGFSFHLCRGVLGNTTSHSSSDSKDSSVDKTIVDDFMQMLCMWKQILEDRKTIE
ncbi:hypothetical protein QYM36_018544, partial [Artemia franciscana]